MSENGTSSDAGNGAGGAVGGRVGAAEGPTGEALARLTAWHRSVADRPEAAGLRSSDLAHIARSSARDARRIRTMLPASAAGLADEIATLLASDPAPGGSTAPGGSVTPDGGARFVTPDVLPTGRVTEFDPPSSEAASATSSPEVPPAEPRPQDAVPEPEVGPTVAGEPAAPAEPVTMPPPSDHRGDTVPEPAPVEPARPDDHVEAPVPEPRAEPVVVPAPVVEPPPAPAELPLDALVFAPPSYDEAGESPRRLTAHRSATGLALRWPDLEESPAGGVVLYRVGSSDRWPPHSPDAADPITVTREARARDDRPFTHALRFVRVWRHVGPTVEEAAASPPVLHAEAPVVAPVQGSEVVQDEDRVVGQWRTLEGTERVHVLRVPIEQAHRGAGDPRFRILDDQPNLGGFDDRGVERGHRYLYQLIAMAVVDGVLEASAPVDHDLTVHAVLAPVADLRVALDEGPPARVDLRWSAPPAGHVAIYRTEAPPHAGVHRETLSEGALPQVGLPESERLLQPVLLGDATTPPDGHDVEPGEQGMDQVPWPTGWTRAHLTAVTLLDGRARVGTSLTIVRVDPVRDLRLVERTSTQVLTFGWPEGAAAVRMHLGARDQDPREATSGHYQQMITHGQYLRDGGMTVETPLPPRGCSLHLVAVAFHDGATILSIPTSMNYQGLLRLRYAIVHRRSLRGRLTDVTLRIESQIDLPSPPPFVLVYHPDRLPLHSRDGRPLPVTLDGDGAGAAARFVPPVLGAGAPNLAWSAEVRDLAGFVRLFVDISDERRESVALLDPSLADLRLVPTVPPWGRRR